MNTLGVHALVWVGDWTEKSCRAAVERTKAAGFDLIEVPVLDPDRIDAAMTRRVLDEAGLAAACSLGLSFDADVSSDDPDTVARGEALLAGALRVTRDIGASYLGGVLYSALGKYGKPASERGRAHCVAALSRLAQAAGESGITLGLETVNRYESNVVNTAQQTLALIKDVGAPNVVVHLDTYHMNIEEGDLARPVYECGERLGYVHVGESHRGYLGSGTVDFRTFFRALTAVGYAGPITFESFSSAVVSEGLSNMLGVWRNLWSDGDDLARHARSFIVDQLQAAQAATT